MKLLIQILKNTPLFADLSENVIEDEILPRGRIQEIPKGNYLISFREKIDFFGVILGGQVNLLHIYGNGNSGIVGALEPGDLFGTDLIFTGSHISPYYAQAVQQTRTLVFPADLLLNQHNLSEQTRLHILEKMLFFISNENIRKEYRLAILFQKGLRDRIMTYLTMQANKRCTNTFSVPFSREEMASYLCVNRTCLSHELSLMEQEGIIKFHHNVFTLVNWNPKDGDY